MFYKKNAIYKRSYATSTNKLGADHGAIIVKSTVGDKSADADACFKLHKPTVTKPRIALNILGVVIFVLNMYSRKKS